MSEYVEYPFDTTENDVKYDGDVTHDDLIRHPAFEQTMKDMRKCEITCQRDAWLLRQPDFVKTIQSALDTMFDSNVRSSDLVDIIVEYARPSFQRCYVPMTDSMDRHEALPDNPIIVSAHNITSKASRARSRFGGLPKLLEHENFPLCPTCHQPYYLVCQFHSRDLPAAFLAAYAPAPVLASITPDRAVMLQVFECVSRPRCHRYSRRGNSTTDFNCIPDPDQNNICERVRWISVSVASYKYTVPSNDSKQSPYFYAKEYDEGEIEPILGWQTLEDMPTVREAVTRYSMKIPRDLFFMLEEFMNVPPDDEVIWQLEDKFGGFCVLRNDHWSIPVCDVCQHSMEIVCSFFYLAEHMQRRNEKFHFLICPVHKNLFYILFD